MQQVNIFERAKWVNVTGDGITIRVQMSPMSFLNQVKAGELFAERKISREVTKLSDGTIRETSNVEVPPGSQERGMRFAIQHTVNDWDGVCEPNGKTIPFSLDALDRVMGFYPQWGEALQKEIGRINPGIMKTSPSSSDGDTSEAEPDPTKSDQKSPD